MTSRDYKLMSDVFSVSRPYSMLPLEEDDDLQQHMRIWAAVVREFCIAASKQNPRFDTARFLSACGMPACLAESIIAKAVTAKEAQRRRDLRLTQQDR